MCLYFYKSGWSLLGPVAVRIWLVLQGNLLPVVASTPGWEYTFVFELMGLAAVVILMNAFIREPKFLTRKYLGIDIGPKLLRFLKRARLTGEMRRSLGTVAVAGVVVLVGVIGVQASVGTSLHLVAIPTGSMRPTLDPGTLVVVQAVKNPQDVRVGDVIEFSPAWFNGSVVHRVIAESPLTGGGYLYTTKGDNNTSPDPLPVSFSNVTGKVIFPVPYLGFLVLSPPLDVTLIVFLFTSSLLGSSLKTPRPRFRRRSMM